jgi:hypothetical protein
VGTEPPSGFRILELPYNTILEGKMINDEQKEAKPQKRKTATRAATSINLDTRNKIDAFIEALASIQESRTANLV